MSDDDDPTEPTTHLDDRDGGGLLASPLRLTPWETRAILKAPTPAEADKLIARARARVAAEKLKVTAPPIVRPVVAARVDARPVAKRARPIARPVAPTAAPAAPAALLDARPSVAKGFRPLDAHDLDRLRATLAITGARRLDDGARHRFTRFVADHEYATRLDAERYEIVAELDRLDDGALSRRMVAAIDAANADLRKKLDAAERRERVIDSIDPATNPQIAKLFGKGTK